MKLQLSRYAHFLPLGTEVLAFNSLSLEAFELTSAEHKLLQEFGSPKDQPEPLPAVMTELVNARLLVEPHLDLPGTASARLNLRRRAHYRQGGGHYRTLRMSLTERCNMACSYCFQQELYPDEQPRMTFDRLSETIEWFVGQASGDHVTVQYFGGEPLMEWPLIMESHELLVQAAAAGKISGFRQTITTNGTLITPERARWMVERDFDLTFSFDGPPELNDVQRTFKSGRGTYHRAAAGLRTYVEAGGSSAILMTITAENLAELPAIVRWFVEESGLSPETIGLNSPQPVAGGWEVGGARLATAVFDIWTYCRDRGVTFHGPGTYIPIHLQNAVPQYGNCVDGAVQDGGDGAWPIYISADGRKSRCLVHHRDHRVEIARDEGPQQAGVRWHSGYDSAYLMPSLHRAPGGIVGAFIGWERLMSILSSVDRAADLQLFPRLDATGGPSLPWAETNIVVE